MVNFSPPATDSSPSSSPRSSASSGTPHGTPAAAAAAFTITVTDTAPCTGAAEPPPPGARGTPKEGCISVCGTCRGHEPVLADLEDLCPHAEVVTRVTGCLGMCGSGPNCVIDPRQPVGVAASRRGVEEERVMLKLADGSDAIDLYGGSSRYDRLVSHVDTFDRSVDLICRALGGAEPAIPDSVLRRARLRSDAMRQIDMGTPEGLAEAVALLSAAIEVELAGATVISARAACQTHSRLRELRMLRGETLGTFALAKFDEAIASFGEVLAEAPEFVRAHVEKAKALRRSRRPAEALAGYRQALELNALQKPPPCGGGLHQYEKAWVERNASKLEDYLAEQAAVERGEFGAADAGGGSAGDSGNGSGRWMLTAIVGLSADSCVYRLENRPPAEPHPFQGHAWHVRVRVGGATREYTPVSTAAEWELGRLDLAVKTYADGVVSRHFATLQQANKFTAVEEQACWVLVSVPLLTLQLPSLAPSPGGLTPLPMGGSAGPVTDLGLVVGGTGIAPALQLLREVADADGGAFGPECKAALLYSSRTPSDVLLLDELRALEAAAPARIVVRHTLTGFGDTPAEIESAGLRDRLGGIPGRHYHFASRWRPYKPKGGPLNVDPDEEAGYRGRVTAAMLSDVIPPPGPGTRVVICGPRLMFGSVSALLLSLGHAPEALVELRA